MKNKLLNNIVKYYDSKLEIYGPNYKGVDWNSLSSQSLRFKKILKIIKRGETNFSLLDYGCGYGALYHYMDRLYNNFQYTGYDISDQMIFKAKEMDLKAKCKWYTHLDNKIKFDYVLSSGIFNVKMNFSEEVWKDYITNTLEKINSISNKGFSFNMLSNLAERERREKKLYYADPVYFFNYCSNYSSQQIELLDNDSLYEFTIIVRK